MVKNKKAESGQSLFEALLALAVFVMAIAAIAHLFLAAHYSAAYSVEKYQAVLLAKEGIEAVRSIRDDDFDNIEAKSNAGIELVDSKWQLKDSPDVVEGKFERKIITISIEPDIWQVSSVIEWTSITGRESEFSLTEHLTYWRLAVEEFGLPVTEGLVLHLDADAIEGLSDNDPVAQWDDLSGEDNHATQATEANRPLYKTNVLSGKPVVSFDGTDDFLLISSFSSLSGESGATIIFVYRHVDTHSGQYIIWADGNILIDAVNDFGASTGWNNFRVRWNLEGAWRNDHIAAISTQEWQQAVITFDGGETKFYTDGGLVYTGSDTETTISVSSPNYMLGGRSAERYFDGDIAEVLIYNRALTDGERQSVEQYLGEKWLGW